MHASRQYAAAEGRVPPADTMPVVNPAGGYERLLLHAAWGLGAVVFLSIGWLAMRPWDPRGAVSLLTHADPMMMAIQVLALALVTSAVATVLAGRTHPDVGVFAVGIGLSLASLKGGNMTHLLLQTDGDRGLCWALAAEGLFWFAVIVLSMFASAFVARWCVAGGDLDESSDSPTTARSRPLPALAAAGIPVLGRLLFGGSGQSDGPAEWRNGLKHTALVAGIAIVLIRIVAAGAPDRASHHGQACAAVAVGFFIGVRFAQSAFPVASTLWSCCAVPIVCVAAFVFSWLMSFSPWSVSGLSSIPASSFLRALPITYIAVGTSASILSFWLSFDRHYSLE